MLPASHPIDGPVIDGPGPVTGFAIVGGIGRGIWLARIRIAAITKFVRLAGCDACTWTPLGNLASADVLH